MRESADNSFDHVGLLDRHFQVHCQGVKLHDQVIGISLYLQISRVQKMYL